MNGNPPDDLRPWGWAPGGYVFKCIDCPTDLPFIKRGLGDKRSSRCYDHAVAAWKDSANPEPQLDDPVSEWLENHTDGRVSAHTITMLRAFYQWHEQTK